MSLYYLVNSFVAGMVAAFYDLLVWLPVLLGLLLYRNIKLVLLLSCLYVFFLSISSLHAILNTPIDSVGAEVALAVFVGNFIGTCVLAMIMGTIGVWIRRKLAKRVKAR